MRLRKRLGFFPVLVVFTSATAQQAPDLVAALTTARDNVLNHRLRATIVRKGVYHPEPKGGDQMQHPSLELHQDWAYDGVKFYSEESDRGPRDIWAWDGLTSLIREIWPGMEGQVSKELFFARSAGGILGELGLDPVALGYEAVGRRPIPHDSSVPWVVDLVRSGKATVTVAPSGKLSLRWSFDQPASNGAQHQDWMVELDPQRGYMIDRREEVVTTGRVGRVVRQQATEARSVDGCWFPTQVKARVDETLDGAPTTSIDVTIHVTDLRTDVPATLFTDVVKHGDTVHDGQNTWKVAANGTWEPKEDPPTKPLNEDSRGVWLVSIAVAGALVTGSLWLSNTRRTPRPPE